MAPIKRSGSSRSTPFATPSFWQNGWLNRMSCNGGVTPMRNIKMSWSGRMAVRTGIGSDRCGGRERPERNWRRLACTVLAGLLEQ
jgi:hypothetical protein